MQFFFKFLYYLSSQFTDQIKKKLQLAANVKNKSKFKRLHFFKTITLVF